MKKGKRKIKKSRLIILLLVLLLLICFVIWGIKTFKDLTKGIDNNTIKAVKTEELNGKKIKTDFVIQFKDYKVESAVKKTKYISKEQAQAEYNKYDLIKKYEMQDIELELNKETLTVSMSEEFLKKELGYLDEDEGKFVINSEELPYKPINQDIVLKLLIEQGYTIK